MLDPETFIVGGGVSEAGDLFLEPTGRGVRRAADGRRRTGRSPAVELAELGNDAGVVGAADLARRSAKVSLVLPTLGAWEFRGVADGRGAAALEFALVVPVLLALVFGIIDYGIYFTDSLAARDGVRVAARPGRRWRTSSPAPRAVRCPALSVASRRTR